MSELMPERLRVSEETSAKGWKARIVQGLVSVLGKKQAEPSTSTQAAEVPSTAAEAPATEDEIKRIFGELLELFADVPVTPWPGRDEYYLPKYKHEVKVIADTEDRIRRTDEQRDSGPGVIMVSLEPTENYQETEPTLYEFVFYKINGIYHGIDLANRLEVKIEPGTEIPIIEVASDKDDIIQPWHHDLNYPPDHHLNVLKKFAVIAKTKKESDPSLRK